MKEQIDRLAVDVRDALASPAPQRPELRAFFEAIGADGYSRAVALRAVLHRWSGDATLSAAEREHAKLTLDQLPTF